MTIITIGISILIREAALLIWDEKVRSLAYFTGNEVSSISLFGAAYLAAGVVGPWGFRAHHGIAHALFKYTLTGRSMRACAAKSCGRGPVAASR